MAKTLTDLWKGQLQKELEGSSKTKALNAYKKVFLAINKLTHATTVKNIHYQFSRDPNPVLRMRDYPLLHAGGITYVYPEKLSVNRLLLKSFPKSLVKLSDKLSVEESRIIVVTFVSYGMWAITTHPLIDIQTAVRRRVGEKTRYFVPLTEIITSWSTND